MADIINVTGLTKRFGKRAAVDHVSFSVRPGEIFGFLGPNGAGKTTTARVLTGAIRPDEGTAFVFGHNVAIEPLAVKQLIGVVPETTNAYVELTAWQNLMLAGALYGIPRRRAGQRAIDLLRQLDLGDRRDAKVRTFSKGMRQRLILCMALINEPALLFLDEPTGGLDVGSGHRIMELLRSLNEGGTTIFLTTHNMDEANRLCHRVAIIDKGRIVATDATEKLKAGLEQMHAVEVSFDRPVDASALGAIEGVAGVARNGDRIRISAIDTDSVIGSLHRFSAGVGARIVTLNTREPSLEDVFLKLTGEGHAA